MALVNIYEIIAKSRDTFTTAMAVVGSFRKDQLGDQLIE